MESEKRTYYQNNKDKILQQHKEYLSKPETKAKIREYDKKRKATPKYKSYTKEYQSRPETKAKRREYLSKPETKDRIKEYYSTPKYRAKINNYVKNRRKTDPEFAIKTRLRNILSGVFKRYIEGKKIKPSKKYGIDFEAIIENLKPFPKDLSKYHIDHIRPLCSFNFNDPKQLKEAFKPENHQWLTAEENMSKGGRYN